jgi:hypothetical protein
MHVLLEDLSPGRAIRVPVRVDRWRDHSTDASGREAVRVFVRHSINRPIIRQLPSEAVARSRRRHGMPEPPSGMLEDLRKRGADDGHPAMSHVAGVAACANASPVWKNAAFQTLSWT